jgi:dienelactone hydrolase
MKKLYLASIAVGVATGLLGLQAGKAQAAIQVQTVDYKQGDTTLEGWLVFDDAKQGKRPGVVIFPAYTGPSDHEKDVAQKLAKMGYVAFVADVYGKGVRPKAGPEAGAESGKYMKDRALLLARAQAGFDQLRNNPRVNTAKLAAIGYCFGGAGALDLARSGAPLVDTVTFHGALPTPTPQNAKNIKGHVLALHGADDPIVNQQAVANFEKEMSDAHVDWQVVLYANTVHAFTDPSTGTDASKGAAYNPLSDTRSWQAMSDLFKSTL